MRSETICRALAGTSLLLAIIIGGLFAGPTSDAQPTCAVGALVGEVCEVVGDPPTPGPPACPSGAFGSPGACYVLVERPSASQCPQGTVQDATGDCRSPVADVPGTPTCQSGYEVVGSRCLRYLEPTCGPQGCFGTISISYTIDCVGNSRARVSLGQPVLTNGAKVSLITVNGSAVVGADFPGGSTVVVAATPERQGDDVTISGPGIAPLCAPATPPTPAPTPPAATPTPQQVPVPTATAAPAPRPTSTATAVPTQQPPTPTVSATQGPITAAPTTQPATTQPLPSATSIEPTLGCPVGQALIDGECLPPCSSGTSPCFDLPDPTSAVSQTQTGASTADPRGASNDFPILPVAAIAGATVVLAVGSYAALTRRH